MLTLGALFSALSVTILYFASIWPTGRFGLVAVASLFTVAAVIETGILSGVYVYIVCSALGMLLIPNRTAVFLYILFFGYYPVVKSLAEQIRATGLQFLLKLVVFNASFSVIWLFVIGLITGYAGGAPNILLVFICVNIAFAIFDFGLSKLIWFYINRISIHIRKK